MLTKSILVVLALIPITSAGALADSFTGSFSFDDDVELFTFDLLSPASVTITSLGYAGGTNDAGDLIPAGGFDTTLTLFDSLGDFIIDDDDSRGVIDGATGEAFDAEIFAPLLPSGTYWVALTQYDNFANGPTVFDGFSREGEPTFTFDDGFGSFPMFNDVTGDGRTGEWALDIIVGGSSVVPAPSSVVGLIGMGLMGSVVMYVRKRRSKQDENRSRRRAF